MQPTKLFDHFWKKNPKNQNSNFLISPNSRLHNIQESENILFFELSIIFFVFYKAEKAIHWGEEEDAWE
jgi:hypothetical protein